MIEQRMLTDTHHLVLDKEEEGELVSVARRHLIDATGVFDPVYDEWNKAMRFYAGDQWPAEARARRQARRAPCLTINAVKPFVRGVVGDFLRNESALKILPSGDGTLEPQAKIAEQLIRGIEYQSDGPGVDEYSLFCAVGGGLGWQRVSTGWCEETGGWHQVLKASAIFNPTCVIPDPDWRRGANLTETCAFVFFSNVMRTEVFRRRWPDAGLVQIDQVGSDYTNSRWWTIANNEVSAIRVAEYWWKEMQKRKLLLLSSGNTADATGMDRNYLSWYLEQKGLRVLREKAIEVPKIRMAIISGLEVLDGPYDWPGKYFPLIPVCGDDFSVEERRYLRGMIYDMMDPQLMLNYWESANTHLIAMAPRSPYVGPTGFTGQQTRKWEQAFQEDQSYLEYSPRPDLPDGGRPRRESPPGMSSGMVSQIQQCRQYLRDTSGRYDASLGAPSNETSGYAIERRQLQGDTVTEQFPNNLEKAQVVRGTIYLDLVPHIYDAANRKVLLVDEQGKTTLGMVNAGPDTEIRTGRFRCVVSTGPNHATQQSEAFSGMMELAKTLPEPLRAGIADLLAAKAPFYGSEELAERLKVLTGQEIPQQLLSTLVPVIQQVVAQMFSQGGGPGAGGPGLPAPMMQ